jgi:hypothetical protein
MSTHRTAAAVLTPVILVCLTACGGDSSSEATTAATDAPETEATTEPTTEATTEPTTEPTDVPETETFTVSGTYAEQGGDPRPQECVSGEDMIIVKSSATRKVVAIGMTSADGKLDKQAKACLYKFILPKVPVRGGTYAMVVGTSEPRDFSRSDAEGLFITGTAP